MQNPVEQRALGPCLASAIGLGCMNLSHAYGVPPQPAAAAHVLLRALDLGVTHFDTAALLAIPGTTNIAHLAENVAGGRVRLKDDVCTRLDALINRGSIRGARYNAATQAEIDTEDFA
jgi:aryl-alcohol dehydrogenase-like predicted oxidoreductase